MKYLTLKLAVLGAIGIASSQAMAAFEPLPIAGSPVAANFNYPGSPAGTTAYIECNVTGNYGSGITTAPTSSADPCALFPAGNNELLAPIATTGWTGPQQFPIASANRPIVVNNTYTGGVPKTVGQVQEYVWRNAAQTECIYGARVLMSSAAAADYLPAASVQNFEINDISRGGFDDLEVEVGYFYRSSTAEVVFRVGRTFTAVQHRGSGIAEFAELPLTTPAYTASINGIDALPLSTVPTNAQQSASLNDSWVSFTTDANVNDDDGSSKAYSSMTYVKAPCDSSAPTTRAGALRFRQTFQELSGDGVSANRFIEAATEGFVPPTAPAVITPVHTDPY